MVLFHLAARFYYFNLIRFCILPGRSSRSGFFPVPDQVVPFIINYPAFIGFMLRPGFSPEKIVFGLFPLCGLIRLAWFNVQEANRQKETDERRKYYQGVPITTSLVVCLTLFVVVLIAKLVGCFLPMLASRFGFDPAVMASPFITTIVDALSLLVFLNIATALLA